MIHLIFKSLDQDIRIDFVLFRDFVDHLEIVLVPTDRFHQYEIVNLGNSNDELLHWNLIVGSQSIFKIVRRVSNSSLRSRNIETDILLCFFIRLFYRVRVVKQIYILGQTSCFCMQEGLPHRQLR